MLGPLLKAQLRPYLHRTAYKFSLKGKITGILQGILNKMANEDQRKFDQHLEEQKLPIKPAPPKTELQSEKKQLSINKEVSMYEAKRLQRIDQILGTKSYFHEAKPYEERIDSENVMIVSRLYEKYAEKPRDEIDVLNPQMRPNFRLRRKHVKQMKKFSQLPQSGYDITNFEDSTINNNETDPKLIKFLAEEELYSRMALGQLDLVMKSIEQQRLIRTDEEVGVMLAGAPDTHFIFGKYTYFFMEQPMSVYRVHSSAYSPKLHNQPQLLAALKASTGNIQEVITLSQIYQCLQEYYYDERVNQYLGRVENGQLISFLHDIQVSPDGRGIMVVVDLLGTGKEYVGLYKIIDEANSNNYGILNENVVFNIQPDVVVRDEGEAYYVQRSPEGMYIELVKSRFHTYAAPPKSTTPPSTPLPQQAQQPKPLQATRHQHVIYKSQPHMNLRLVPDCHGRYIHNHTQHQSNNILLDQSEIGCSWGNRVYLLRHEPGSFVECKMEQLTRNNGNMGAVFERNGARGRYGYIDWSQEAQSKWQSWCYEVLDVGYLVIRYAQVVAGQKQYLRYGAQKQYARYVTLVPYASFNTGTHQQHIEQRMQKQQQIEQGKQQQVLEGNSQPALQLPGTIVEITSTCSEFQLVLPSTPGLAQPAPLDHSREQLCFVCPEQQFFSRAMVKHINSSNIYLIMNMSIESVYNRSSVFFQPLRQGITPYSLYLDGYHVGVSDRVGQAGLGLRLEAPLLSVDLEYSLWKKELNEKLRPRIYTETITINEDSENEIVIKVVSNKNHIKRPPQSKHEAQPVILHIPSTHERMNEALLEKLTQKGVIFVEIVKGRGFIKTNMIDLLRGTKSNYTSHIQDIKLTIQFIKQSISDYVSIYAQGEASCYATLLLNIYHNPNNELFEASVLHEGLYEASQPSPQSEYFFGAEGLAQCNPMEFVIYNPTKKYQVHHDALVDREQMIYMLSNIVFSSLPGSRIQSRKFINKLRGADYTTFPDVFLKEHQSDYEKDLFNLAYLFKNMRDLIAADYQEHRKKKMNELFDKGNLETRTQQDRQRKDSKNKNQYQ